jgi:hypothetical protein
MLVQFQQVQALSQTLGLSVAERIRRALDEFLERHTSFYKGDQP